jgi:hypothetical protein
LLQEKTAAKNDEPCVGNVDAEGANIAASFQKTAVKILLRGFSAPPATPVSPP